MTKKKPAFNLDIELRFSKDRFEDFSIPLMDQVELYGNAIKIAKELFDKPLHVTEDGYINPGEKDGIKTRKAVMDVDSHPSTILLLKKALDRKIEISSYYPGVHFNYVDGQIERIGVTKSNLMSRQRVMYLVNFRKDKY
jgi:hypothetical protein